ncbi:MAG: membrane protein insertion efficiency factor YidD [bacterium]|nr:membrane protein insertion efficiency factor YidD [bacterium]
MTNLLIKIIDLYQLILSPDHSFWGKRRYPHGYCRFIPSCSEYCKKSIREHGVVKGLVRGAGRIIRCNPLSQGGYDPA